MDIAQHLKDHYISLDDVCSSIAEGVCIAGKDFSFIYWNASAKKILFDEPDESRPETWAQRYGLFDVETEELLEYNALPMVMALNGETFDDYRVLSRNGANPEGYILSVSGRPLRNGLATVGGITTFRNITTQVKLERELEQQKKFYKNILDLMPGIVFIKDLAGKYIYGNRSFLELLEARDIVGHDTKDFLVEEMAEKMREHDKIVITSGKAQTFEEVVFWKDKKRSIFLTTRFPYFNTKKEMEGVCAVAHDITRDVDQRLQIEEEQKKSAHISKLAALGTLAAEISHELRNTLTVLMTSSKIQDMILKSQPLDHELMSKQVDIVESSAMRMESIIHSLNDLSRESSKEKPLKFSVKEMFEDLRSITIHRIKKSKIDFELQYPDGDPGMILGKQIQLTEVFLNLLLNAIDAVEGQAAARIKILVTTPGNKLRVEVHDSGPGVKPEIREKIFEPFFTTKDTGKGTGLGLSISSKIINQHEGTLSYEDTKMGHFFVVTLPRQT